MNLSTMKNSCLKFLGLIIVVLSACSITFTLISSSYTYGTRIFLDFLLSIITLSAFLLSGIGIIFSGRRTGSSKLLPISLFVLAFTGLVSFVGIMVYNAELFHRNNPLSVIVFVLTEFICSGLDVVLLVLIGIFCFKPRKAPRTKSLSVAYLANELFTYNFIISPILLILLRTTKFEFIFSQGYTPFSEGYLKIFLSLALILYFSFCDDNAVQEAC